MGGIYSCWLMSEVFMLNIMYLLWPIAYTIITRFAVNLESSICILKLSRCSQLNIFNWYKWKSL